MLLGGVGGGWFDRGPPVPLIVEKRLSGMVGRFLGTLRWAGGRRICTTTGLSSSSSASLAIAFSSAAKIQIVDSLNSGTVLIEGLGVPGLNVLVVICEMRLTVLVDLGVETTELGAVVLQSLRALILS